MPRPQLDYGRKNAEALKSTSGSSGNWESVKDVEFAGSLRESDYSIHPLTNSETQNTPKKSQQEILNDKKAALYQQVLDEGGLENISPANRRKMEELLAEQRELDEIKKMVQQATENVRVASMSRRDFNGMVRGIDNSYTPTEQTNPQQTSQTAQATKSKRQGILGRFGRRKK